MDLRARRRTLRLLSNGIYIITSCTGDRYGAATITWLSQASFTPPLVMTALRPDSNVFQCLAESRVAVVHILDRRQQDIAQRFFSTTRVEADMLNGEPFVPGMTRAPVLTSVRAYFECLVRQVCALGDHTIVILEVIEAACRDEMEPLTVEASPWSYGG